MRLVTVGFVVLSALSAACAAPISDADEGAGGEEISETSESGFHGAAAPRVSAYALRAIRGGERTTLEFRVRDSAGYPITQFAEEHTKLFHLIIVSRDLSYFTHAHPAYVGGGKFRIDWTPAMPEDDYAIYAQLRPRAASELSTVRFGVHVPSTVMKASLPVTESTSPVTSGTSKLSVVTHAGGYSVGDDTVHFAVTDTRNGQPAQLGTFLGARAHVIAVKAGAADRVFLHGHDMRSIVHAGGTRAGGHGGHGGSGGAQPAAPGELAFDLEFPEAGLYRLWVQYNQGGRDITQFVTIEVGATTNACKYDDPNRSYVAQTSQECALVMAACIPGRTWFDDACGCGCAIN